MTEEDIQKLSKEQLQDIVLKIHKILTSGQKKELRKMIKVYKDQSGNGTSQSFPGRMSDDFVKEKMMQIQEWEHKIDEGELYLNIEEYEDYSDRYWDPDWIIKYYDNQGICDKIQYMIQFAADCIDDRRYQEAHEIYEWIWQMSVSLKAAFASSCLDHQEKMMQFCRECFVSDSTVKNFLRLFGMEEMAETYGTQGKEILINTAKGNPQNTCYNLELHRNIMCDFTYYSLVFYTGDFDKAKNICKNSKESLGGSE